MARLFEESKIVSAHSLQSADTEPLLGVLGVCVDLIGATLSETHFGELDSEQAADFRAATSLGLRVVNSVAASTLLLEHGYFHPASAQLRDLAETAMLLLYFSEEPFQVRRWRTVNSNKRNRHFGRAGLRGRVKNKERFEWLDRYFNLTSEYGVHPSAQSIIANHDGSTLCIGPVVNNELYVNTLRDLTSLTWHATDVAGDAFRSITGEDIEELQQDRVQRYREAWKTVANVMEAA